MNANPVLLQKKYARIIEMFAEKQSIPREEALDFFYHSLTYQLMRDGISDFHCMSDGYLTEEIKAEFAKEKEKMYALRKDYRFSSGDFSLKAYKWIPKLNNPNTVYIDGQNFDFGIIRRFVLANSEYARKSLSAIKLNENRPTTFFNKIRKNILYVVMDKMMSLKDTLLGYTVTENPFVSFLKRNYSAKPPKETVNIEISKKIVVKIEEIGTPIIVEPITEQESVEQEQAANSLMPAVVSKVDDE